MPVVLDMANSIAARERLRMAIKERKAILGDWMLNKDGEPTKNP